MNYRPDENTLMAYLYGELDASENQQVEAWLKGNPEAVKELESIQELRQLMGNLSDREVIEPPIISTNNSSQWQFWNWPYFKTMASIAASFLLILFAAKMLGVQIGVTNSEFRISFGGKTDPINNTTEALSKSDISKMIAASLSDYDRNLHDEFQRMQANLDDGMSRHLQQSEQQINKMLSSVKRNNQDQITAFLADMQYQNKSFIENYVQLTHAEQQQQIQELLNSFALYMDDQRASDLEYLQARINLIEKEKELFKLETEQLLSGIVDNPNKYIE